MATFDDFRNRPSTSSELLGRRSRQLAQKSVEELKQTSKIGDIISGQEKVEAKIRELDEQLNNLAQKDIKTAAEIKERFALMEQISKKHTASEALLSTLNNRLKAAQSTAARAAQGRIGSAHNTFMTGVSSALGPKATASSIHQLSQSSSMYGPGSVLASSMPGSAIEAALHDERASIDSRNEAIMAAASGMKSPSASSSAFEEQMGLRDASMQRVAQLQIAMGIQRKNRMDIPSRHEDLNKFGMKVAQTQGLAQIDADVLGGKAGTREQVQERMNRAGEKFISILEKFNKAVAEGADNVDDLSKELSEVQDDYEKQGNTLKSMDRHGMDSSDKMYDALSIIGNLGTIARAGSQIYRTSYITSEMQQQSARTGIAKYTNDRYNDVVGAGMGDMKSLRRMLTSSSASAFGNQLGSRSDIAMAVDIGGLVAQTGDKAVKATKNAATNWRTGGALNGTKVATEGLAQTSGNLVELNTLRADLTKNLTRTNVALQGAGNEIALNDELNYISDQNRQAAFDFFTQSTMAGRGLGGQRDAIMAQFSGSRLQNLARTAGVSATDIPGLLQAGKGSLGGEFNGLNDIQRAGLAARGGIFDSASQYLQARGRLSGSGGGADDLEKIMTSAVKTGMDNSKNIMEMVSATASMAKSSAALGVNTTAGATEILSRTMTGLAADGVSQNMRAAAALSGINKANESASNKGMNLGNVIEFARFRQSFKGSSVLEQQAMASLSLTDAEAIQKDFRVAQRFGLGGVIKNQDDASKLWNNVSENSMNNSFSMFVDSGTHNRILKKQRSGQPLSDQEKNYLKMQGTIGGFNGIAAANAAGINTGDYTAAQSNISSDRDAAIGEELLANRAVTESNKVARGEQGINQLGGFGKVAQMTRAAAESIGTAGEEFEKAVVDAASKMKLPEDFGKNIESFNSSVKLLASTVRVLNDKMGDKRDSLRRN